MNHEMKTITYHLTEANRILQSLQKDWDTEGTSHTTRMTAKGGTGFTKNGRKLGRPRTATNVL